MIYRQHTFRIPNDIYVKLEALAVQNRRHVNSQIILLLEKEFGPSEELSSRIAMRNLTRQITSAP